MCGSPKYVIQFDLDFILEENQFVLAQLVMLLSFALSVGEVYYVFDSINILFTVHNRILKKN